ncbi:Bug family tripartite tricarboxylate transporter substrate binding protein [Alicycliphilus denitrificans]|uniref:Bug family tripartite tricarboxylate transporter substrate binding protein n=1 Tax=Alicycliphilus denitrificans TaxID=179636 RepID=UPI003A8058E7
MSIPACPSPKSRVRRAVLAAAAGAALAATLAPAQAQTAAAWPNRPVRIVVPYPAGGSSDVIARLLSQQLQETLGQPVLVDNKAGANGNIGAEYVAKSTDGHTFLLADVLALAISGSVYTKLRFDPATDLVGAAMLAYSPHLLVVHPSVPANSLKELVALSQREPLSFAVTAIGSPPHLAGVAVEQATGARWQYIPYKGGAQAINDTMGGQAQVLMNGMLATLPHVQSGKLKVLAVSKRTRMPLVPQVPTLAESGVPDFESGSWQGVLAPRATPPAVLKRLNAELTRIIRSPDMRARLAAQGAEVSTMDTKEFARFYAAEHQRWAGIVKALNLTLD